ncbi:MAG: hypothetical protein JW797_18770 [Bradymonadales bacterium]|nr:hypothetical protein [Bradymonadales bacterium]
MAILSFGSTATAEPECTTDGSGIQTCDYGGEDVFLLEDLVWRDIHTNIGILTIGPTFTLQAEPGRSLQIEAQRIDAHGHLSADAAGNPGGAGGGRGEGGKVPTTGSGLGTDGTNAAVCPPTAPDTYRNAGGGGGGGSGYGGSGGGGGHGADASDDGCQGGAGGSGGGTWGSTTNPAMGSGGGGGGGAGGNDYEAGQPGGRGGGLLILNTRSLHVTGLISADGGQGGRGGTSPNYFHGGGGGGGASGGGIDIRTTYLSGGGTISARGGNGGNGGAGDIQGDDYYQGAGGGGGGGGRVQVRSSVATEWAGTVLVPGGNPGVGQNTNSGPAAAGQPGQYSVESANGAPEADAGGPYVVGEGLPVILDGTGSTDPDDDTLQYRWDVYCDNAPGADPDLVGATPSVVFPDNSAEPYTVCLTAFDGELSHTAIGYVTVFDQPPTGIINLPAVSPYEGETFAISAVGSFADGGGTITDTIVSYQWDWSYDLVFSPSGDVGLEQTHAYPDNGRFFIALQVTDDDGSSVVTVAALNVTNVPPVIVSHDYPTEATESVPWSYQMEVADPGSEDTFTYEVLAGPIGMEASDSGLFTWTPLYAHARIGSVVVNLSVTDKDFGRDTQSFTINVEPADNDLDGMPDGWELQYDLDPTDPLDRDEDPDGDGVSNIDEFLRETSPHHFDGPGAPRLAWPPLGYEVGYPVEVTLSLYPAIDPDGSPLTYRIAVYDVDPLSNPAAEPVRQESGLLVDEETHRVSFEVTQADELQDNTRHHWRGWAHDGLVFGPPSEVGNFFVNAEQECPSAPTLLTPPDGGFVSIAQPLFIIQNAIDPDEDRLVYIIIIYQDAALLEAVTNSGILVEGEDGVTSWAPTIELEDNTPYWWRARAIDAKGCESEFSETFDFLTTFENRPPNIPVVVSPAQGATVTDSHPEILLANSTDPNRDPLSYTFEIDTSLTFDTPNRQASGHIEEPPTGSTTGWTVPRTLADNSVYHVRVQAFDGQLYSGFGFSSFRANHTNDLPSAPLPVMPPDGTTMVNQRPRLTVENALDPDGETLLYHFQVFSDDQLSTLVLERADVTQGIGQTSWRANQSLFSGQYWWRARAIDHGGEGPYSEPYSFYITLIRNSPDAGTDPITDTGTDLTGGQGAGEACGCGTSAGSRGSGWWIGGLALISLAWRRRRR